MYPYCSVNLLISLFPAYSLTVLGGFYAYTDAASRGIFDPGKCLTSIVHSLIYALMIGH